MTELGLVTDDANAQRQPADEKIHHTGKYLRAANSLAVTHPCKPCQARPCSIGEFPDVG